MRSLKLIMVSALILTSGLMAFAGGQKEEEVQEPAKTQVMEGLVEPEPIIITDFNGKEITLQAPAERVVVFNIPMFAVINAIGAAEQVVGVVDYIVPEKTRFPYFSNLPSVGMNDSPDFEKILSLDPDAILVPYYLPTTFEEKLEPDVQVIRLNIGPPLTYKEDVEKIAAVFGKDEEAKTFISWYQEKVEAVRSKTAALKESGRPSVFNVYSDDWGESAGTAYGTYGADNFWVGPMLDMAGGNNIAREVDGDWVSVDPEWVIEKNPDVMVRELRTFVAGKLAVGYDASSTEKIASIREKIMNESSLISTNAVKNSRVHMIDITLSQSEWFLGLQYLAKWYHPDLFTDLDPQEVHQEYIDRFQNIDFDVSKEGVFVYP
jgi:iron complex transport system substrate-binding protein